MKGLWMAVGIFTLCWFQGCSEDNVAGGLQGDAGALQDTGGDGLVSDAPSQDTGVPLDSASPPSDTVSALDLGAPDAPTPQCTSHDQCDDGVECTGDLCTIDGVCSHELADEICLIEGVCLATGEINPVNGCEMCDSAIMLDGWSARPDATCDDGDPCTLEDKCNKDICQGTPAESCCGDGIVEGAETCDGDCPSACDDGDACTLESLVGQADTCDAQCVVTTVSACQDGDGCCPEACSSDTDADCPVLCGNGLVEPGELCDGDCPSSCDDGDACTIESLSGSAETCDAQCVTDETISACVSGDSCCPAACDDSTDNDCPSLCGNGVVDAGETCDGLCPTSCSSSNACTPMTVTGSHLTCDAECVASETITACLDGDGCCPAACDESNDNDCDPSQTCGIDIVVHCLDHPTFAALAKISTTSQPGVMTWSYPPNNTPLVNWCATNNGDPGQHLEATSGCVTAIYETGLCVMPEELFCESTLCYQCP